MRLQGGFFISRDRFDRSRLREAFARIENGLVLRDETVSCEGERTT